MGGISFDTPDQFSELQSGNFFMIHQKRLCDPLFSKHDNRGNQL
jgi:hypothetical protein